MSLLKNISVYKTEYTKKRFGENKDGGYIVLAEPFKKCKVLYSYGISDDISFEIDFVKNNPNSLVRLFDHTITKLPYQHENFSFLKEGISAEKSDQLNTLENHLNYFGDLNSPNKTLKIDVEWNEWEVFDKMPERILSQFDQILCEFHFIPMNYKDAHTQYFTQFHQSIYSEVNKMLFQKYQSVLDKIVKHYYIFHLHINNSLGINEINTESVPPLVEISLINKNLVQSPILINPDFPIENLDYPNKSYKKEILNFNWSQFA